MSAAAAYGLDEVKPMLQQRALDLAIELAPGGRREGAYYVAPNPARGSDRIGSFKVFLSGPAAGGFEEFDAGGTEKGSIFDLIIYAGRARDISGALAWAKAWLGLDTASPGVLKQRYKTAAAVKVRQDDDAMKRAAFTRKAARALWQSGEAIEMGGPVAVYLRNRGIRFARLVELKAIRQVRGLEYQDGNRRIGPYPVMVAAMQDPAGDICAVHRTYLRPDASAKADVPAPKKMLGPKAGAVIRVWPGDGDPGVTLTEGIEDALTIAQADPARRVWAVGDLGNLAAFMPPDGRTLERVTVVADNDWNNPGAQRALDKALIALAGRFGSVHVARSPVGKDFNDFLTQEETSNA